jgi:penicillin-binding protein-related factor A (putative recombinase)
MLLPIPISLLSILSLSSDDAKKKEMKKKKNVDKEETTIYTCVFHGLMMHGEAKQNRQQSVFSLA